MVCWCGQHLRRLSFRGIHEGNTTRASVSLMQLRACVQTMGILNPPFHGPMAVAKDGVYSLDQARGNPLYCIRETGILMR